MQAMRAAANIPLGITVGAGAAGVHGPTVFPSATMVRIAFGGATGPDTGRPPVPGADHPSWDGSS